MARWRALSAFSFLFTILSALAIAQTSTCELANVVDAHGHQIVGLTKDQFRASLRNKSVSIAQAKFETGPERILILVDANRSMLEEMEQSQLLKIVATDIVLNGPPQAQLSLIIFSSTVETKVGFNQERDAISKAILGLSATPKLEPNPSRPIALNDAIFDAAIFFFIDKACY